MYQCLVNQLKHIIEVSCERKKWEKRINVTINILLMLGMKGLEKTDCLYRMKIQKDKLIKGML